MPIVLVVSSSAAAATAIVVVVVVVVVLVVLLVVVVVVFALDCMNNRFISKLLSSNAPTSRSIIHSFICLTPKPDYLIGRLD